MHRARSFALIWNVLIIDICISEGTGVISSIPNFAKLLKLERWIELEKKF